jgi:hypothetical protein
VHGAVYESRDITNSDGNTQNKSNVKLLHVTHAVTVFTVICVFTTSDLPYGRCMCLYESARLLNLIYIPPRYSISCNNDLKSLTLVFVFTENLSECFVDFDFV